MSILEPSHAAGPSLSASLPSTMIDDFNETSLNGPDGSRTNLWGGRWSVIAGGSSMAVTYNGPGTDGSRYSAGVTGVMTGKEWVFDHSQGPGYAPSGPWSYVILHCTLSPTESPVNVACHGLRGIQFWMKGDGGLYRIEVPNAAVTNANQWCWYGFNFTAPAGVWTLFQVPFSEMTRQKAAPMEGLPEHLDGSDIMGISIYPLKSGTFAFSLAQISLYGSYVPNCISPGKEVQTPPPPSPTPTRLVPTFTLTPFPTIHLSSLPGFLPALTVTPTPMPLALPALRPVLTPTPHLQAIQKTAKIKPAQWPSLDPTLKVVFTEPPANIYITFADGPGRYQVEVVDEQGNSLEAVFDHKVVAQSDAWVEWDGLGADGKQVKPGQYFVILSKDGKALKRISVFREQPSPK